MSGKNCFIVQTRCVSYSYHQAWVENETEAIVATFDPHHPTFMDSQFLKEEVHQVFQVDPEYCDTLGQNGIGTPEHHRQINSFWKYIQEEINDMKKAVA
jgi:hypothetical protein